MRYQVTLRNGEEISVVADQAVLEGPNERLTHVFYRHPRTPDGGLFAGDQVVVAVFPSESVLHILLIDEFDDSP